MADSDLDFRKPDDMAEYCAECVTSALGYLAHPWFVLPQSDLHAAFLWRDENGAAAFDPMVVSWRVFNAFDTEARTARRLRCDQEERERLTELHSSGSKEQRRFHLSDLDLERHSLAHPSGLRLCNAVLPTGATGTYYDSDYESGAVEYEEKRFCAQCSQTMLAWAALDSTNGIFVNTMYWVSGSGVLTDQEPSAQREARAQIEARTVERLTEGQRKLEAGMEELTRLLERMKQAAFEEPERHKKPWDDEEQARLLVLYQAGVARVEIAETLRRKESAINRRIGDVLMLASPGQAFTDGGYPAFPDLDVPEALWKR